MSPVTTGTYVSTWKTRTVVLVILTDTVTEDIKNGDQSHNTLKPSDNAVSRSNRVAAITSAHAKVFEAMRVRL